MVHIADRSVSITLKANVAGVVAGFKTAQTAAEDFASKGLDKIGKNTQHINTLSNGVGALGIALVGIAGMAVKSFADFDSAMSGVAATGDDARGSLDALRDAAIDAGARTKFSATEAAGAMEALAKAGVSAADILGGGLDGALDLAAAGELDVADAAEIAATMMTQFGKKGTDVSHIADVIAAGAGKAQGEVTDMANAMKYAGIPAAQLGISLEETAGTLALFAKNGIIGEQAGTSFRSMIMSLTAPSKAAADQMESLNISVFDGNDKFIGLAGTAGILHDRLGELSDAERNAALGRIFGNESIGAANILVAKGAEGVREWTAAVDDQGFAAETAATKMDNLKGDIEEFTGALETAFIQAGSGGNDMLRGLTQGLTDVVNGFNGLSQPVQNATLMITGGAGMVALGVAGMGKLVVGISETREAMKALGISAKTAGVLVGSVGGALAIATVGLTIWAQGQAEAAAKVAALADSLDATSGEITRNTREIVKNDLAAKGGWWIFDKQYSANNAAKVLGIDLETLTDAALGNTDAMERVSDAVHATDGSMNDLTAAAEAAGVGLGDYVAAQGIVEDAVKGTNTSLEEAIEIGRQKQEADGESVDTQGDLAGALGDTTDAVVEQVDALQDLIDGQSELAGVVLSARDAQRNLEAAVDDASAALEANGATLDITTEKGRANQSALDDIGQSTWDLIEAMKANGSSQAEIQGVMQTSRDRFVAAATAMGMGADEANRLADQLGLIPSSVTAVVDVQTASAQASVDRFITVNGARRITIPIDTVYTSGAAPGAMLRPVQQAQGGYIAGPGTATSDSIPALLSNGEYVVKASAVQQYGRAFFDSVNAQRFASGGFVGQSPAPAAVGASRHTELHVHNEGRPVTSQDIVFAQKRLEALEPTW